MYTIYKCVFLSEQKTKYVNIYSVFKKDFTKHLYLLKATNKTFNYVVLEKIAKLIKY